MIRFRPMLAAALTGLAGPAVVRAQQLRIDANPSVTIGVGGDATTLLRGVVGAYRLATGSIVVVEAAGPAPIRTFTARGKLDKVVARAGGGPGEIQILYWAGRVGDSVVAFDFALNRATTYDLRAGTSASMTVRFRNAPSRPSIEGLLAHSRLLVTGMPRPFPRVHADGAYRDSTYIALAAWASDSVTVLGQFPRLAVFAKSGIPGPVPTRFAFDSLVPQTTILAHDDRVIVADPQASAIVQFDAHGKRLASLSVPFPAAPYDAGAVARGRASALTRARNASDSTFRSAMYDLGSRPKSAPRFKRVIPGPDGELWVEKFWVDGAAPRAFAVLDRAGRIVGRLSGAPAIRFTEFGRDYALGIATDDDGVETVQLFRLTR